MDGHEFASHLPEKPTPQREEAILQAVRDRKYQPLSWRPVRVTFGGSAGIVFLADFPLGFGDTNTVFVTVSPTLAQKIAIELECLLPTSRIIEAAYDGAVNKLPPFLQTPDAAMGDTSRMVLHSDDIRNYLLGIPTGTCEPFGKHWIYSTKLHSRQNRGCNFGLYDPKAPSVFRGRRLWQPPGFFHNLLHVDYSQILQLVRTTMIVDGTEMKVEDVARNPNLWGLVSHEGVLQSLVHPGLVKSTTEQPTLLPASYTILGRTMKLGSVGEDVKVWQRLLGIAADGVFGPQTKAKTIDWQKAARLVADGIVGPASRNHALRSLGPQSEFHTAEQLGDIPLIEALNYTRITRASVDWLVIHSMEAPEKPTTAEAVARWFAGKSGKAPRASAHYCFDNDSVVQCVPEDRTAWHVPGANPSTVGFELSGYHTQTREDWLDPYSESMLWIAAKTAAGVTLPKWNIPIDYVDAAGILNKRRGITTHVEMTKAFKVPGGHVDPGPHFPMDRFLDMIETAKAD